MHHVGVFGEKSSYAQMLGSATIYDASCTRIDVWRWSGDNRWDREQREIWAKLSNSLGDAGHMIAELDAFAAISVEHIVVGFEPRVRNALAGVMERFDRDVAQRLQV